MDELEKLLDLQEELERLEKKVKKVRLKIDKIIANDTEDARMV